MKDVKQIINNALSKKISEMLYHAVDKVTESCHLAHNLLISILGNVSVWGLHVVLLLEREALREYCTFNAVQYK